MSGHVNPLSPRSSEARAQIAQAASETVLRAVADQRFEPPLPAWVEVQHVVVIGQVELGKGDGSRRTHRQILDATAESVPEPPEPAAADRGSAVPLLADVG